MINLDVTADVDRAERQLYRYQREAIPKAVNSAINKTATNVQTALNRHLRDVTGLKIKEIKGSQFRIKSNYRTLTAIIVARRKSFNLRRFVSRNKLAVGAFSKQKGVKANPWKHSQVFEGAFIIRGRTHGKLIVVKRTGRTRSGIKGLYGPSPHIEFQRPAAQRVVRSTMLKRFRINFERDLNYQLTRIK